jgi:exosortase/archaeosortase family protein
MSCGVFVPRTGVDRHVALSNPAVVPVAKTTKREFATMYVTPLRKVLSLEPAAGAFAISAVAIWVDYIFAPVLNVATPPLVCGLIAVFLGRSRLAESAQQDGDSAAITRPRLALFLLLHAGLPALASLATAEFFSQFNLLLSAAKYFVLAPGFLLLPWTAWKCSFRRHRAAYIAAAVALLTVYPHRIFTLVWPWYSQILGQVVYAFSEPFVSGLQYVAHPDPALLGSRLNVMIVFGCSGLRAIGMFQIVFAIILLLDWPAINRQRALLGYVSGLAMMLAANALRIVLVVVIGNHFAPGLVARYHMPAGWVFFGAVVATYAWSGFGWLTAQPQEQIRVQPAGAGS